MAILIVGLLAALAFTLILLERPALKAPVEDQTNVATLMKNLRAPSGGIKEVYALVAQGSASVPVLLEGLKDDEPRVRGLSCWALGELKISSAEVVDGLAARLSDDDHEVRSSAVMALKGIRTVRPELVARLEGVRRSDPHPSVRDMAEDALLAITGSLPTPLNSVDELLGTLASPDPLEREGAINAIGRRGLAKSDEVAQDKVLKALVDRLLHDDYFQCRQSAPLAMWRIGRAPDFVIEALSNALDDRHFLVKSMAAQVLGNFGRHSAAAVPRLQLFANDSQHRDFQKIAQEAIGRIVTADAGL